MIEAIITGAGRGIGLETALWLAENHVNVLGVSRNIDNLNGNQKITSLRANITIEEELSRIYDLLNASGDESAEHRMLIHNAGKLINKPFAEITPFEIGEMTTVNFTAPLRLTQQLIPWLTKGLTSHIVYVGSMGGFQGSSRYPGLSIYSATKSAGASLLESLAEEYKKTSMRFNTLAMGAVNTEMFQAAFPGYKAPLTAKDAGAFVGRFALEGHHFFNGKVLPVAGANP